LPSNILVSFVFLAIVQDTSFIIDVIPAIPIGMTIDTLFVFMFVVFLRFGVVLSTILSLSAWFALALVAVSFSSGHLICNVAFYIVVTLSAFLILEKIVKVRSVPQTAKTYTKTQIVIRAILSGSVVASVIVISRFFSPYVVGIFATFPAVLISTLVILAVNQSREFAQATGKILVLSSSNIFVYALSVYFTYGGLGITLGTVISFACAFLWVWLFHPVVQRLA